MSRVWECVPNLMAQDRIWRPTPVKAVINLLVLLNSGKLLMDRTPTTF
jgi:hypothetical protein